jgi:hypothetical protein
MKKLYYLFALVILSTTILVDIFILKRMIDLLTIVVLVLIVIFIRKIEQTKKIYFISAAGCLIFAIALYYLIPGYPYFDIAANWTYAFLFAGVMTIIVQEFKDEKHK